jgi:antitoxin component YwqK of YwqJK toxin-antitoxin module
MKKLLILFVLVIYSCGGSNVINFNEEKEFFEEIVNLLLYKNNPFNGIVEVYFDNGQLSKKFKYKEGYRNGLGEIYYENGQLFKKLTFKDGFRDGKGIYEEYYKNGELVKLDEYGDPIINYEMDSDNLQFIEGKLHRNGSLFSGTLNSLSKKDGGMFEFKGTIHHGEPIGIPMSSTLDVNNPEMFFYRTKNGYEFDESWKNYLSLIKQKTVSENEETILLKELFQDLDDSGNTRKIGELKFNPKKNEVILLTLMDNQPFSGKVFKNKIVSQFSEFIDSNNKIRYDLDGKFIVYHDNGNPKIKGEFSKGVENNKWTKFNENGEIIEEDVYYGGDKLQNLDCYDVSLEYLKQMNLETILWLHDEGYVGGICTGKPNEYCGRVQEFINGKYWTYDIILKTEKNELGECKVVGVGSNRPN